MTNKIIRCTPRAESSFNIYQREIRRFKRITREQEQEYARIIQEGGPVGELISNRLVEANLGLVITIAKKFHTYNNRVVEFNDLPQSVEGESVVRAALCMPAIESLSGYTLDGEGLLPEERIGGEGRCEEMAEHNSNLKQLKRILCEVLGRRRAMLVMDYAGLTGSLYSIGQLCEKYQLEKRNLKSRLKRYCEKLEESPFDSEIKQLLSA